MSARWMLNCYFLSDSGVGILAFLCVVVKYTENLISGAGRRPQKYGKTTDKNYGVKLPAEFLFKHKCESGPINALIWMKFTFHRHFL
jgi:hypothetical protein